MARAAADRSFRMGRDGWLALTAFAGLAVAGTWPLALSLTSSLPGDYGDPLFVTWVMAWVGRHLTSALTGDPGALLSMWNAPIFAPEQNTLAYSEHFIAQAFQVLPVYWLSGNPLLAYNIAFLSTFVLSGFGAYLFVRELTGHRLAGLVAGVVFAVNDYRTGSLSHLQTLSAQWVPLACLGMLIFARSGSRAALAFGALSTLALNLSSVYYMFYCTPVVAAFGAAALWHYTAWRTRAGWTALAVAMVCIVVAHVPFLLPYVAVQRATALVRSSAEVESFSFTVDVYRTFLPRLTPMLALAAASLLAWRSKTVGLRWAIVFFVVCGLLGAWLSLGPVPRFRGQPVALPGLYQVLFDYVPGYQSLRVPQRFAMVLMAALAVLAGVGAAEIARRAGRVGAALAALAAVTHLAVQWMGPIGLDRPLTAAGVLPAPSYLRPASAAPAIYRLAARMPPDAVFVELPFGDPGYDLRYMYFGLSHRRPLLNGYSGIFPPSHRDRAAALRDPLTDLDRAWSALGPATHVVVHLDAFDAAQGAALVTWLTARGAALIGEHDRAQLWHRAESW